MTFVAGMVAERVQGGQAIAPIKRVITAKRARQRMA
jgi:hypothetical protein